PPSVEPPHDAPRSGRKDLLRLEGSRWILAEELLPEAAHRRLTDAALSVGRRERVLEHAVVDHGGHQAVDVVPSERVEEPVSRGQRRRGLEIGVRSVAHAWDGEAWWIRTTDSPLKRRELCLAELTPPGSHSAQSPRGRQREAR